MTITPACAAVFALIFVALSVRTLLLRRRAAVPVGHGDDPRLMRAARVHANFAEYVPIALLIIYFRELQDAGAAWIHLHCLALLLGRVLHAYGVSQVNENYRFRVAGMVLTLFAIISAAVRLLAGYLLGGVA